MFHILNNKMRRKDKEIKDTSEIDDILKKNNVCHLALSNNDEPYTVTMHYGYEAGALYLHSAGQGRKIDMIKKNAKVCFQVVDSVEIIRKEKACNFTSKYRSVVGNGKASILEGVEEKRAGLLVMVNQITGTKDWDIPNIAIDHMNILKIEIENMSGKKSGF
ncbi:pyridoxamine 5'-phosphate oxidase family protein [Candidatus Margulisiibacteriota bacterium]